MTEWKSAKDDKPTHDIVAIVINEKGWMFGERATYHHDWDVWVWYAPHIINKLVLDVTHYLEIPPLPQVET